MKACFVTANFPPEACGGTEQVVAALLRELVGRGAEAMVVSGSDCAREDRDVLRELHDGIQVARLLREPGEYDVHGFIRPRLLELLRAELRAFRPDVVHVHAFSAIGLGIGALCRELGVPMVCTFHDLWITCARFFRLPVGGVSCPEGAERSACVTCVGEALGAGGPTVAQGLAERDRLVRTELETAAACTAPSKTAADYVRVCTPYDGEVEIIPHGLLRTVAAGDRVAAPDPSRPLRVGTFGGLVPEKGVMELVEGLRGLPCELHLAGPFYSEDFAAEIREVARQQGTPLYERGRYDGDAGHPARDLDLAVFPSKCQETYGLVVDEALAHGVPVVCSDAGALRERSASPGVLVTPIERLGYVLQDLIGPKGALAALREQIPTKLPTIGDSADRHLELYRSIV